MKNTRMANRKKTESGHIKKSNATKKAFLYSNRYIWKRKEGVGCRIMKPVQSGY